MSATEDDRVPKEASRMAKKKGKYVFRQKVTKTLDSPTMNLMSPGMEPGKAKRIYPRDLSRAKGPGPMFDTHPYGPSKLKLKPRVLMGKRK